MVDFSEELSKDTRPLEPEELSDNEFLIIHKIEDRLRQAQRTRRKSRTAEGRDRYLFVPEVRHPRVILLDGNRGTGKTSLMLTLTKRWHKFDQDETLRNHYQERLRQPTLLRDHPKVKEALARCPMHVSVLDILDFDPLPPGMPLIAAIVEAWHRLVSHFGDHSSAEDETGALFDLWQRL